MWKEFDVNYIFALTPLFVSTNFEKRENKGGENAVKSVKQKKGEKI